MNDYEDPYGYKKNIRITILTFLFFYILVSCSYLNNKDENVINKKEKK